MAEARQMNVQLTGSGFVVTPHLLLHCLLYFECYTLFLPLPGWRAMVPSALSIATNKQNDLCSLPVT